MFFQFSPPVRQPPKRAPKRDPEPERTTLTLAPFSPNPKIFFENVQVGATAVETLYIKNPSPNPLRVSAQIAVDEGTVLQLNWLERYVTSDRDEALEISWTPTCGGTWRYMLHVDGGGRLTKDVPVVLKAASPKNKRTKPKTSLPRYPIKKSSPLQKKKSPMKRAALPNITNIPEVRISPPELHSNGKENKFVPQLASSFLLHPPSRRDTYIVKQVPTLVPDEQTFEDSLEKASPDASFEIKLKSDSFILAKIVDTPGRLFEPEVCSTDEKSVKYSTNSSGKRFCLFPENETFDVDQANISTETYVKGNLSCETYVKGNLSCETYVKNDLSTETYTKETNHTLDLTPEIQTPKKARLDSLAGSLVKSTIEANLWSNSKQKPLVTIQEESFNHTRPLKRKSEVTFTVSPKRANCGAQRVDWQIDKTAAVIDAETALFLERQQDNFKNWLNAILTPPDLNCVEQGPLDVAKLWRDCQKKRVSPPPAIDSNSRLNSLRAAAVKMYQCDKIQTVLKKVEAHVASGKLSVRNDRDLHLDLALQADVMKVILSYNPLWLRLGLETIYGRVIPLRNNSDVVGLTNFLWERLFRNPLLLRKHKSVYSSQYIKEIKKFILGKFLSLVYFLDCAKKNKLIAHDPCLFCKNAPVKESREALLVFSREVLSSMGDVTKYLKHLGYVVDHKQTYLDEFDYTVKCLGGDLRDGVRLTKVLEIILVENSLRGKLRVPAISRLQKIHNMKEVFAALESANFQMIHDITPRDIVDGHKEKTLSFLWQIIYKFQTPLMAKSATIIASWWRSPSILKKRKELSELRRRREQASIVIQRWIRKLILEKVKMRMQVKEDAAITIQKWVRRWLERSRFKKIKKSVLVIEERYLALKQMRTQREDFEELKYRALIVQRRFRANVEMRKQFYYYSELRSAAILIQRVWRVKLVRRRFLVVRKSAIVIQSCFRGKVAFDRFQRLKAAAVLIQRKWRAKLAMVQEMTRFEVAKNAATTIQRRFRETQLARLQFAEFRKTKQAAILIQRRWKGRVERRKFERLKLVTVFIQRKWRAKLAMIEEMRRFEVAKNAATTIQRRFRVTRLARLQFSDFKKLKEAAIFIQRQRRAKLAMRIQVRRYKELKEATILIQRKWRAKLAMMEEMRRFALVKKAATTIQRRFRETQLARLQFTEFRKTKEAAIFIQRQRRAKLAMMIQKKRFEELKEATILIQRKWRAKLAMTEEVRRFALVRKAATTIQRRFRETQLARLQFTEFRKTKEAAIFIQRQWRAKLAMEIQVRRYKELKEATILIQRKWRAKLAMMEEMRRFALVKKAATTIQRRFRETQLARLQFTEFRKTKEAAIFIQGQWRAKLAMRIQVRRYKELKEATILIQRKWRAKLAMTEEMRRFALVKKAATTIQRRFRETQLARLQFSYFKKLKEAAIFIQRQRRAKLAMMIQVRTFKELKEATILVQRKWRGKLEERRFRDLKKATICVQRKWRAKLTKREELKRLEAAVLIQRRFREAKRAKFEFESFKRLKKVTVFVQRKFRAKIIMREEVRRFQSVKKAAVLIQRRFREFRVAKLECDSFRRLKVATIVIQRKWRATLLMRSQRQRFQEMRNATLVIQRRFRAKLEFSRYQKLKKSAILIQRRFRAKIITRREIERFRDVRNAAVLIQRRFRASRIAKSQCEIFRKSKQACILIQRKWRAQLAMRIQEREFQELKVATLVIQRRWRAKLAMKQQMKSFEEKRRAAVVIQRRFRSKLEFESFQRLKKATVVIQRRWRATLTMRVEEKRFEELKKATVFIQRRWRLKLEMKSFKRLKEATVTIQRRFRLKLEQKKFEEFKRVTVFVQRRFRAKLAAREAVKELELLKNDKKMRERKSMEAVTALQKYARGFLVRRRYAPDLTPEAIARRKLVKARIKAATRIQAAWRGYKERCKQSRRLFEIRKQLEKVNKNVSSEKTLGARCKKAFLQLCKKGNTVDEMLLILKDIDYITRRCQNSLRKYGSRLPRTLYMVIIATNRAPPEIKVCTVATWILINIYRYQPTRDKVWLPEFVEPLITVMLHFCDKEYPLFSALCTLLWFLLGREEYKVFIRNTRKCHEKFQQIREKCERKAKMVDRMKVDFESCFASFGCLPLPSTEPDWGLELRDKPRVFQNSCHALQSVWKRLDFK